MKVTANALHAATCCTGGTALQPTFFFSKESSQIISGKYLNRRPLVEKGKISENPAKNRRDATCAWWWPPTTYEE